MAIKKKVMAPNGVRLEYHRIGYVQKVINKCNLIQVISYPNELARKLEAEAEKENAMNDIYCSKNCIRTDYDESMTVQDAYKYIIDNVDSFKGAKSC